MRINNEDLLDVNDTRAAVSMGASFTLKPFWLGHIANYSIQLVFTGSPNGTLSLQVSNDKGDPSATADSQMYANVTNWTTIPESEQQIVAAGDHTWQAENAGYTWVRVVYTRTSGTGSVVTARVNVKGV